MSKMESGFLIRFTQSLSNRLEGGSNGGSNGGRERVGHNEGHMQPTVPVCGRHEGCILKAPYATLVKVDTMLGRVNYEEVTYALLATSVHPTESVCHQLSYMCMHMYQHM